MFKKRSQYAMEYLFVISFSILLILPTIALLLNSYSDVNYTITTHQVHSITEKLSDSAISVYYLGEGSMTKLFVSIPKGIQFSSIENNEILFRVRAKGETFSDIYSISKINVTGVLPTEPGNYKIIVESRGDHVWIGT